MSMEISKSEYVEMARIRAYFPYRRHWVAKKAGEETQFITKQTAHIANRLAREGWSVWELFTSENREA